MEDFNNIGTSLILIVDDNPKNLQILGNYLQNEGYKVE
jgi:CheY-like chemotaxis protein